MKNKWLLTFSCVVASVALAGCQTQTKATPKTTSKTEKIDTDLVANANPVTKVKIGETYVAYTKTKTTYSWGLIKLVDQTHMLYVLDDAHNPISYYTHSQDDGGNDEKSIDVNENLYQKRANKSIYPTKTTQQINLSFGLDETVGRGSEGQYWVSQYPKLDFKNHGVLFWRNGRYVRTTYDGKGPATNWYVSKIKLPNSAKAYMAQYKLTKLHLYGK